MTPAGGPIALLISDVDGTLVTSDKRLTPAAIQAATRLRERDIGFTLISSRPPRGLAAAAGALNVVLPMAAFNGGTLFEPDLRPIEARRLQPAIARRALDMLQADRISVWVFARDQWFLHDVQGPRIDHERLAVGFDPTFAPSFEPVVGAIDKIVGVSDDHALLSRLGAEMQDVLGGEATVEQSQPYYLDITHPDANKGSGVRALCRHTGIDPARTAVIGDMFNDVAMFQTAGFSIAMGQSPERVKQMANAVAPANDENGFAWAVEHLILPRLARAAG